MSPESSEPQHPQIGLVRERIPVRPGPWVMSSVLDSDILIHRAMRAVGKFQPHAEARWETPCFRPGSLLARSFLSVIGEVSATRRGDPKIGSAPCLRERGFWTGRGALQVGSSARVGCDPVTNLSSQWCGRRVQWWRDVSQRETRKVLGCLEWPRPKQQFVVGDRGSRTADGSVHDIRVDRGPESSGFGLSPAARSFAATLSLPWPGPRTRMLFPGSFRAKPSGC